MSFSAPLVMGVIPFFAAFAWWLFRPARAASVATFAHIRRLWADRNGLTDRIAARRRRARGLLLGLGALLALVALARPQWGKIDETTFDQSREVLLALDLSRSMLVGDVSPTRLERSKLLIASLLDQLRGERVGLVVFAGTSFLQSPLSADYEVLRDFLRDLDPSYLPQGGTDYASMMQTALKAFGQEGDGDRYLVVLSDGEAHEDEWKTRLPALRQKGIRVIGLGVGTAEGGLVPDERGGAMKDENGAAVLSRLEPATLQDLARETGGAYRDAAAWVDIPEVVRSTVEQGRAGRYAEQKQVRLRDRYQWFLAPALLFLLLSYCLELPVLPVPRALTRHEHGTAPVRTLGGGGLLSGGKAITAALLIALAAAPSTSQAAPMVPAPGRPGSARPTPEEGQLNPLATTVEELADKPLLNAGDYARLATTTVDVASKPDALHGPSRLGVIDDGLRAVDEGEKLDAQAAEWPKLRTELERLEQEQEKQQQQEQTKQDQQPQRNSGGPGEQQQDEGGGSQQKQDPQQKADQAKESQDGAGTGAPKDESDRAEEPQPLQDENAGFGKLDEAKPTPAAGNGALEEAQAKPARDQPKPEAAASKAEPQPADEAKEAKSGTRMVGGGPVRQQPIDGQNLALVEALDRMDRIKDGDSPATLFDRMNRAEGAPPQKKNDKNW